MIRRNTGTIYNKKNLVFQKLGIMDAVRKICRWDGLTLAPPRRETHIRVGIMFIDMVYKADTNRCRASYTGTAAAPTQLGTAVFPRD